MTYKDALSGSEQNSIVYEYDDDSRVTKTTRKDKSQDTGLHGHQDLVTESVYDARGNMITSKRVVDVSTSYDTIYAYGDRDQLTKVTDPAGRVAKYEHNEQLWRTKEIQETVGDDVITEFTHDADGNVITRRAKNSTGGDQDTLYDYDDLGRLTNTGWADGEDTAETFDLAGNKVSTTQRNGTVIDRSYDDANRLTSLALTLAAGVVGATSVTYEHDGAGRITEAATEEASGYTSVVERTYNTLGKIEAETQVIDGWNSGNGRTITYTYNVKGQKTATEYPVSGDDITYIRDDLDRVDKISLNTEEVVDYTYLGSRVIQKEFPGSSDNRSYDAVGRLTGIHHKDTSSGNTLAKFDYELDDGDMIIEWDRFYYDDVQNTRLLNNTHDEGSQFAYDGAGRLVTSLRGVPTAEMGDSLATNLTDGDYDEKIEWVYDQVGNRLTQKVDATIDQDASYDEINALTTLNAGSRNYNDNGNFDPATGGTYQYDYRNQLGRLSVHANGRIYDWHHDAFGRTIDRDLVNGTTGIRTYFDGDQIAERVSFSSAPNPDTEVQSRKFVFGAEVDELLLHIPTSIDPGDRWYSHADQVFSVHLLADDTGSIGESYRYEEFGSTRVLDGSFSLQVGTASLVGSPFRLSGRPFAQLATWAGDQWFDLGMLHYNSTLGVPMQVRSAGTQWAERPHQQASLGRPSMHVTAGPSFAKKPGAAPTPVSRLPFGVSEDGIFVAKPKSTSGKYIAPGDVDSGGVDLDPACDSFLIVFQNRNKNCTVTGNIIEFNWINEDGLAIPVGCEVKQSTLVSTPLACALPGACSSGSGLSFTVSFTCDPKIAPACPLAGTISSTVCP